MKQLDSLEECWESTTIRLAEYQQKLAQRYSKDMKKREFGTGDLVIWKDVGNARDVGVGKLALNWEGPYRVTTIVEVETYYLEDIEERPLPWPWNV